MKLRWLLDNVPEVRAAADADRLAFGTIDTWLMYKLSKEKAHVTDVTNASRTMLMDLHTLNWDDSLCSDMGIPQSVLPAIKSSSEVYGHMNADTVLSDVPISGIVGDQHAALLGQACVLPGEAKNTYGTGCFMLMNTGEEPVQSSQGLLTTVAFKLGDQPAQYALEGSTAIAGAGVQWLRDEMQLIPSAKAIEEVAAQVPDTGDVYFVPAFSGLYAPHWRMDARGTIVGMTRFTNR
jgi:glycerol kinase